MAAFELFRYQLLPASQQLQQDLFGRLLTVEELRAQKNEIFWAVLQRVFPLNEPDLLEKVVLNDDNWLAIKLAPKRKALLNRPDFRTELVEDWPHITVFINNDPEVQVVGVSRNQRAFQNPFSVVRAIERRVTRPLLQTGLTVQFHSIYDEKEFWALMEQFKGQVEKVRFEMIAPNMANISRVLKVDLKRLNQETNAQKTTLELEAMPGTSLEVTKSDSLIASCVEYSAEGGGDIKVKLKGIKKIIGTTTSVKVVEIDEATFESATAAELNLALKGILG